MDTWSNCLEPWHPPGLNPIPVRSRWNSFICPLSENAWVPLCCWNTKSLCIYARCRRIDSTPGWDSKGLRHDMGRPDEPGKGTEFLQCVSTHLGWQHRQWWQLHRPDWLCKAIFIIRKLSRQTARQPLVGRRHFEFSTRRDGKNCHRHYC